MQALKEMTGNIALFGTYDTVIALLTWRCNATTGQETGIHLSWPCILLAGSLAGVAYYTVSIKL